MNLNSTNLILRYDPGQFTFRHFDKTASDAELYALAKQINAFQAEDQEAQVVKVQVYSIW